MDHIFTAKSASTRCRYVAHLQHFTLGRSHLSLVFVLFSLLITAACGQPAPTYTPASISIPYNKLWSYSTHNAYWVGRVEGPGVLGIDPYANGAETQMLDQLLMHHVRSLEWDLHNNFWEDDWHIIHTNITNNSQCSTLTDCLRRLVDFHKALPDHDVVSIVLELKNEVLAADSGLANFNFAVNTPGLIFDSGGLNLDILQLNAMVNQAMGTTDADVVFTPQQLMARCSDNPRIIYPLQCISQVGWPTNEELRGKFIFYIYGGDNVQALSDLGINIANVSNPIAWVDYADDLARTMAVFPACVNSFSYDSTDGVWFGTKTQEQIDNAARNCVFFQAECPLDSGQYCDDPKQAWQRGLASGILPNPFPHWDPTAQFASQFLSAGGIVRTHNSYGYGDGMSTRRQGAQFVMTDHVGRQYRDFGPVLSTRAMDEQTYHPDDTFEPGVRLMIEGPGRGNVSAQSKGPTGGVFAWTNVLSLPSPKPWVAGDQISLAAAISVARPARRHPELSFSNAPGGLGCLVISNSTQLPGMASYSNGPLASGVILCRERAYDGLIWADSQKSNLVIQAWDGGQNIKNDSSTSGDDLEYLEIDVLPNGSSDGVTTVASGSGATTLTGPSVLSVTARAGQRVLFQHDFTQPLLNIGLGGYAETLFVGPRLTIGTDVKNGSVWLQKRELSRLMSPAGFAAGLYDTRTNDPGGNELQDLSWPQPAVTVYSGIDMNYDNPLNTSHNYTANNGLFGDVNTEMGTSILRFRLPPYLGTRVPGPVILTGHGLPLHRCWSGSVEHLVTGLCDFGTADEVLGMIFDGPPSAVFVPLYHLMRYDGEHFYTTDMNEVNGLISGNAPLYSWGSPPMLGWVCPPSASDAQCSVHYNWAPNSPAALHTDNYYPTYTEPSVPYESSAGVYTLFPYDNGTADSPGSAPWSSLLRYSGPAFANSQGQTMIGYRGNDGSGICEYGNPLIGVATNNNYGFHCCTTADVTCSGNVYLCRDTEDEATYNYSNTIDASGLSNKCRWVPIGDSQSTCMGNEYVAGADVFSTDGNGAMLCCPGNLAAQNCTWLTPGQREIDSSGDIGPSGMEQDSYPTGDWSHGIDSKMECGPSRYVHGLANGGYYWDRGSVQCCSGVLGYNPPSTCVAAMGYCKLSSNCCAGSACVDNKCACSSYGGPCASNQNCCGGLACDYTVGTCGCINSAQTFCNGSCTELSSDPNNCGRCGNVCPSGNVCQGGACATACTAGSRPTMCNGICTDIISDPDNCGGCSVLCQPGYICQAGACVLS